jgi:hypothetical protein
MQICEAKSPLWHRQSSSQTWSLNALYCSDTGLRTGFYELVEHKHTRATDKTTPWRENMIFECAVLFRYRSPNWILRIGRTQTHTRNRQNDTMTGKHIKETRTWGRWRCAERKIYVWGVILFLHNTDQIDELRNEDERLTEQILTTDTRQRSYRTVQKNIIIQRSHKSWQR